MIGHLRGTLLRKTLPAVLLDVGGVGYEIRLPLSTFEALPAEGAAAELEILTLFRNEALELYGFGSAAEKELFSALLGVGGVGPKIALSLLSALPPGELAAAIQGDRPSALERVPGVGKKTAQRLVLELKDKLKAWSAPARGAAAPAGGSRREDALAALENLGYRRVEAEKAVDAASAEAADAPLSGLLRLALRRLGGGR